MLAAEASNRALVFPANLSAATACLNPRRFTAQTAAQEEDRLAGSATLRLRARRATGDGARAGRAADRDGQELEPQPGLHHQHQGQLELPKVCPSLFINGIFND